LKKFFLINYLLFLIFSFLILSDNEIGEKGAEEISKSISLLAGCPMTNFSLGVG
jgi:hypothetical protein